MTGPRRAIVQALEGATDHPDVVELHRRAMAFDGAVSLATVYRTVKLLQDKGIVERHAFGDGRSRYETAASDHHDHLIDVETGKVIEFHSDAIERLQEEIASSHGYDIVSHRLEIYVVARRPARKTRSGSRSAPPPARPGQAGKKQDGAG